MEQGCLNNSTAFVELNCPSSPVSNLQECGVMEVEGCPCGQRLVHAKVDCGKGNELTVYLSIHYSNIY